MRPIPIAGRALSACLSARMVSHSTPSRAPRELAVGPQLTRAHACAQCTHGPQASGPAATSTALQFAQRSSIFCVWE